MSRLTDLIAQAKAKDHKLGADLEREINVLLERLPFGLNFERHKPEAVELPLRPIRKGDKVRVLAPRGSLEKGDQRLWQVAKLRKDGDRRTADLELYKGEQPEAQTVPLDDLVVVAEFGDKIFPGLVSTGKVERGGDRPYHTVINGENYHVLKALTYTHRGKVDAIYIDPPYNTGAKDWKYNNDYVEGDDLYRHSKWLAFMERRLLIAHELLNPDNSVLIVTIDEKEYLRLGLLLEQTFPEANIQMVTSVINPSGSSRATGFARTDEYLFFVFFGSANVSRTSCDMLNQPQEVQDVRWDGLLRTGSESLRRDRPNMFYPVFFTKAGKFHSVGAPLPLDKSREEITVPEGCVAVFPITNGTERRWRISHESLKTAISKGFIRFGPIREDGGRTLYYIASGTQAAIESGTIVPIGKDEDGALILPRIIRQVTPFTTWNQPSHSATDFGSTLLGRMLNRRKFPFPKSLYAVQDALRFVIANKPDAVILDFFAGSGTTAHAIMRLNRQDGGRRQCISVTNNEVAADEQRALRQQGLRPGDGDWEKFGICDYITKPRVAAAITGMTPDNEPIRGDYKFIDEFPMSEGFEANAEFFTLTYETPVAVNHNIAFARIAPLLWMRAGSRGKRIDKLPPDGWAVVEAYGLLSEVDAADPFVNAIKKAKDVRMAFIVTDDDRRFQNIVRRLPSHVEPVRLYESYLTNFSFMNGD
ncbi:site-specific DNA-methyltransferase [Burkholderia sp. KJ006]|uniref:site-specific DNA-methyltransferase n=1 Tax=Burkholderia sp. KJ006 TaxID=416344 RepID=UPI0005A227C5|nr:DNA methyltransferase [Burkholderia sp. KJ006]